MSGTDGIEDVGTGHPSAHCLELSVLCVKFPRPVRYSFQNRRDQIPCFACYVVQSCDIFIPCAKIDNEFMAIDGSHKMTTMIINSVAQGFGISCVKPTSTMRKMLDYTHVGNTEILRLHCPKGLLSCGRL
jgi:hypothetical protein